MKVRPSCYNIIINFDENNYLVFQSYTKSLDLISKQDRDILTDLDKEIDMSSNNLKLNSFLDKGYLIPITREQEFERVNKVKKIVFNEGCKKYRSKFAIIPTHNCNLACFYCFEKRNLAKAGNKVMSIDMANKAFSVFKNDVYEDNDIENATLVLYGGEPLMQSTKEVVTHLVNITSNVGMKTAVTSNLTNLHLFKDLLGLDKINSIVTTLDTTKEFHDKRRLGKDGSETFETIVKNIDMALEYGVNIELNVNVDSTNIKGLAAFDNFIKSKGWHELENLYIKPGSIHISPGEKNIDKKTILKDQELYDYIVQHSLSFDIFKKRKEYLRKLMKHSINIGRCGANYKNYFFDPYGDIYNCSENFGDKNEIVGSYITGKLNIYEEKVKKWQMPEVLSNDTCLNCNYSLVCGGGCPALMKDKNYFDKKCEEFKESINLQLKDIYYNIDSSSQL